MDFYLVGSDCLEWIKVISPAVVALVIGLIAAGIAWRQYRVAQAKLKLDLFDKRIDVFNVVWQFLSAAVMQEDLHPLSGYSNVIPKARFLFGRDMAAYLEDASKRHTELWVLKKKIANGNATHQEIDRVADLSNWFYAQASTIVKARFAPYLDFERWR